MCTLRLTPLHLAMAFAEWPVAAALLDAGARPTTRDGMGMGPFHLAALYGNVDCARGWLQRFVEWDVDAKVWPLFGNTPLHLAAGYASGMQPLAQILIFFSFFGGASLDQVRFRALRIRVQATHSMP